VGLVVVYCDWREAEGVKDGGDVWGEVCEIYERGANVDSYV